MIKVGIRDAFMFGDGVGVYIVMKDGNTYVSKMRITDGHAEWHAIEPDEMTTVSEPTFALDGETARELMYALQRHFENLPDDTRLLRKDYEAERARVDKLTNALIDIATAEE